MGQVSPWYPSTQVLDACSSLGFFHVVNHGIANDLVLAMNQQMRAFFDLSAPVKNAIRRSASNARGFFDDELTKQRRDWKEGLDFGFTPTNNWLLADDDNLNANLDGFNQFPPTDILRDFRLVCAG